MVFGIFLMLIGGTLGFAFTKQDPWVEIAAVAFGIGAGLTFDEFALWVHLEDVYWADEGRQSVDAAIVALGFVGLVLTGAVSTNFDNESTGLFIASVSVFAIAVITSLIAFSKFRLAHGMVGLFVWPLALWGACRLAKPNSPWAKGLYGERNPEKQARAEARYGSRRIDRFKERVRDAIGGRPTTIEERERR
jgi:lysyl-tRNA synthetase class 2